MSIAESVKELESWIDKLPSMGMETLGGSGQPTYMIDFIIIGAVKRSLSLASGFRSHIETKNMICARALIRMQLDTVSRLLAYTYVKDAEELAKAVFGGKKLSKHKSKDGKRLSDAYLIDQMAKTAPWVRKVYDYTSGYIHFSERQIFDSVASVEDETRKVTFVVGHEDDFPEQSWTEIVDCFNHTMAILDSILKEYRDSRKGGV